MEIFTLPWWSALLAIVLIDLVLAGDNAIVIALAARNLPPEHQNKAIVWGTIAAIVVRSTMTLCVVVVANSRTHVYRWLGFALDCLQAYL